MWSFVTGFFHSIISNMLLLLPLLLSLMTQIAGGEWHNGYGTSLWRRNCSGNAKMDLCLGVFTLSWERWTTHRNLLEGNEIVEFRNVIVLKTSSIIQKYITHLKNVQRAFLLKLFTFSVKQSLLPLIQLVSFPNPLRHALLNAEHGGGAAENLRRRISNPLTSPAMHHGLWPTPESCCTLSAGLEADDTPDFYLLLMLMLCNTTELGVIFLFQLCEIMTHLGSSPFEWACSNADNNLATIRIHAIIS